MLLTRLPLGIATSFDLHVLGTPPALILSQDQTLHKSWSRLRLCNPLTKPLAGRTPRAWSPARRPMTGQFVSSFALFRSTGGAGARRVRRVLVSKRQTKNAACAAHPSDSPSGDPQTYALLYCSVFKERTRTSGPTRTGSLTAPEMRDVRVTAIILPPPARGVNPTACCAAVLRYSPPGFPFPPAPVFFDTVLACVNSSK